MLHVIAYDVADDKRRNRIATLLESWGRRVQKSVFECDLNKAELEGVLGRVREALELPEDRCHCYRLCADCAPERIVIGSDIEPEWEDTLVA